ncbi:MAG TPA: peptide chain release factor N(5)-glutamine methyltransferase, partial [Deltaproteobacteria bacterium]|nr:peptide chain release factor N(5)-glutamine methyltransferase [Deltaproteobacteria bacterium]
DLQTEVSQFEPRKALDGGKDGLFFYRYLLDVANGMLRRNGKMILEIGFDQRSALKKIQGKFPAWKSSSFIPDLQRNFRVWVLGKEAN